MEKTPGCSLCGHGGYKVLEKSAGGVRAVKCANCGLIYLNPPPDLSAVSKHYDGDYYAPWVSEQKAEREKLWLRRLSLLHNYKKPGRLLDVGCGEGSFLSAAKKAGWEVSGTEVSEWALSHVPAELGVRRGDLNSVEFEPQSFDAVTMWHVLEHTCDPRGNLEKIYGLLKKDGVLIIAVPNAANRIFRAAYPLARGKFLRYYEEGEREIHVHHFTSRTLSLLLEKTGFEVLRSGLDRSALSPAKKILESVSLCLFKITGLNWGEALEAVAKKKGSPSGFFKETR